MGVALSSPDSAYTQLCAVYRCTCGATVSESGLHAGDPPPGWELLSAETCVCAHCAQALHAAERPRPGASA
jgi:hypothetical protein